MTFLASFVSIQAVLAVSARPDLGFSASFLLLSIQIALLLGACSAAGAALGWRLGARAFAPPVVAALVGVSATLFVVVAAIVTTVALVPELWVVLWIVPVPALLGGAAAAIAVPRAAVGAVARTLAPDVPTVREEPRMRTRPVRESDHAEKGQRTNG